MNDRQLVEFAARAAGLAVTWEPVHNCFWVAFGQGEEARPWNPLDDDGEAFRLAVLLDIHHGRARAPYENGCWARWDGSSEVYREALDTLDSRKICAAARRAIVRAAAARFARMPI